MLKTTVTFLLASAATTGAYREPSGAYRRAEAPSRQDAGELVEVDDLTLYVVRPTGGEFAGRAVVWGHDIYGWESGRTKAMVDRLVAFLTVLNQCFVGSAR